MHDSIEILGKSLIQHGPLNSRIYLMKLHVGDLPGILGDLDGLARAHEYGKILAKIPKSVEDSFEQAGYAQEATIPGYFNGREKALFIAKYFDSERNSVLDQERVKEILTLSRDRKINDNALKIGSDSFKILRCSPSDAQEMSEFYRKVFKTYPFPIDDPDYLYEMMTGHVRYYCIRGNEGIIALAASEMDEGTRSVEMTDFATLPLWQGRGLAYRLLSTMELDTAEQGMITAFSIARALSYGMNITFGKLGYTYGGLLTNNTNIAGCIESMTVWYKRLNEIL